MPFALDGAAEHFDQKAVVGIARGMDRSHPLGELDLGYSSVKLTVPSCGAHQLGELHIICFSGYHF
jgi:hypothetical protein